LGVAGGWLGVAARRAARLLLGLAIPLVGPFASLSAKAAGPFMGVAAHVGGAMVQIISPVAHAARDVVEAMTQGLGVEPAARVDAGLDPLIARRAVALIQQDRRQ